MRKIKIFILILLIGLIVTTSSVWATNSNVGTSVYSFMKIEPGARSIAMGGAFVGLADDESALFFNPAGLLALSQRHFIASYNNYLTDIQSGFVGYIHPWKNTTRLGVSINYFNYGDMTKTDMGGEELGKFGGSDLAFTLTYVEGITPQFNLGVNAKIIYESIDEYTSTGIAGDVGFLYALKDNRTRIGGVIRNFGTQLSTFEDADKEKLPTLAKLGLSHLLHGLPFLVAGDVAFPFDNDIFFNLGVEFLKAQPLFIRVGWSSFGDNYKTQSDKDDWAGLSGGLGIHWKTYTFDYAYSSYADLGGVHRISVSGAF